MLLGIRAKVWLPLGALLAILASVPILLPNPYILSVLVLVFFYITLSTAWNLLGGFAGQVSLGHAAFMGIGAYTVAILGERFGISPWLGVPAGTLLAVAFAYPFGLICFRLRGVYFILVTLAIAEVLRELSLYWVDLTKGARGLTVLPLYDGMGKGPWYWMALSLALASIAIAYVVTRSKLGLNLLAIREDEDAAASVGIDPAQTKLTALALSVFLTGLAGSFYGSYIRYIDPDVVFGIRFSMEMIFMPIIGGAGTLLGPLVGAIFLALTAEYFRGVFKDAYLLVYGVLLVAVIMVLPGGIMGLATGLGQAVGKRLRKS